ncbi:MAG: hypothetical protein QOK17_2681 [Sphingomonadales bacterium]|jgi:hypothetical protein|nr:hypothetical protein [Sphingomonadales bacterium]
MMSVLPILERLSDAQHLAASGFGTLTVYVLVRHVLRPLIEKGPDYIAQLVAYKIAMAGLQQARQAPGSSSDRVLVLPSRPGLREGAPAQGEKRAA